VEEDKDKLKASKDNPRLFYTIKARLLVKKIYRHQIKLL